jgi:TP901 family phage tail tape measure protein
VSVNVGTLFATLRLDTGPFNSSLGGVGGTLRAAGAGMTQAGGTITTGLTLPILGAGAAIVSTSVDFDTSMRRIIALTNVTEGEIGGIRTAILALSGETGRAPQELADAFYFLASAGFTGKEALDVLDATARASASGLGSTADIAQVTGLAINAWGKENLTAADAVDQLIAAVREGTAEPAEFARALGGVAGSAAQVGAKFDEVTAAMAAMTIKGIDADAAAVSLNAVFTTLFKPTSEAEKQLKAMGLSAEGLRASIKEKGLLPTLDLLKDKFDGNEEATAAVFGNVRALRGIFALTNGDAAQTAAIFENVANAGGSLEAAFAATEGPGRELDRGMADLKGTLIEFGETVVPIVIDILGQLRDVLSGIRTWWESLSEGGQKNVVTFALLAAAAGPVLLILGALVTAIGAILSPIGLAIAGIAALAAAFESDFLGIKTALSPVIEAIGYIVDVFASGDDVASGFVETMENLGEKLGPLGPTFKAFAETLVAIADTVVPALIAGFQSFVDQVLPVLQAAFDSFVTNVLPVLIEAFGFITDTVIPAFADAIGWVTTNILPPLMSIFQTIAETIIPILAAALDTIVAVVRDNWPTISSIAEQVGNAIKIAMDVIAAVIQAVAPVVRWLAETIFPILGAAAGLLLKVIDGAFKAIGVVWNALVSAAQSAINVLTALWNGFAGFFKTIWDGIGAVAKGAINFLIGIVNGIIGAVNSIQVHIGRIGLDTPAGFIGVGPFDWNGLQLPKLGYLAEGTDFWPGGWAMLGERGPELAFLPRGTAVANADDTQSILQGGGKELHNHYHLTVTGNLEAKDEPSVLGTLQRLAAVTA